MTSLVFPAHVPGEQHRGLVSKLGIVSWGKQGVCSGDMSPGHDLQLGLTWLWGFLGWAALSCLWDGVQSACLTHTNVHSNNT